MSRAQELRKRIYEKIAVKNTEEMEALGQMYYDYVLDVIDAVSCCESVKDCIDCIKVRITCFGVMSSNQKYISTTTEPEVNKPIKTKLGKEVRLYNPDIVADSRAYEAMKGLFDKEEGYDAFIDGATATVTMTGSKIKS